MLRWLLALGLAILMVAAPLRFVAAEDEDDVDIDIDAEIDAEEAEAEAEAASADEEDVVYEQQETSVHPLTDMDPPSPDVVVTAWLPNQEDTSEYRIPVEKEVSVVAGFLNARSSDQEQGRMKVKAIMGSLNSVYDFSYHVQNFTLLQFDPAEEIEAGEEVSFEYTFKLSGDLDLQPMRIALTIFYEDFNEDFTSQFFNETVTLYEPSNGFDLHTMGTYIFAFGFTALAMWGLWSLVQRILMRKNIFRKSSQRHYQSTVSSTDDEEWDRDLLKPGTPSKKKKSKRGKR